MVVHRSRTISLPDIPNDVFVTIFQYCSLSSLWALSLTCINFHDLVVSIGWSIHQRARERNGIAWLPACIDNAPSWTPLARLRSDALAARNLRRRIYNSHDLVGNEWREGCVPVLALGPARLRLVVGVDVELHVYKFEASDDGDKPPRVRLEEIYAFDTSPTEEEEHSLITSLEFFPDNGAGADRTLLAGFGDGRVMRITLPNSDGGAKADFLYEHNEAVQDISVSDKFAFSLSRQDGCGVLSTFSSELDLISYNAPEPLLALNNLGMASLILPSSSPGGPYVAVGSSSPAALSLHALVQGSSTVPAKPTMLLGLLDAKPNPLSLDAATALAHAPPAFPGAHSDTMLVSGWHDSVVRLHDIRVPPTSYSDLKERGCVRTPVLLPVMELSKTEHCDMSPTCIATGGPMGTTITSSACDGIVAFWDVRNPRAPFATENASPCGLGNTQEDDDDGNIGWCMIEPRSQPYYVQAAPVSGLALAGSRCFGVTNLGGFVLDFGEDRQTVNTTTSPQPISTYS